MKRDFAALDQATTEEFDVLVIGGGITGAWTAYDATRRGLKVALVEKRDWAYGTSSASSKMIHGGLRYLENYDFSLVRHALQERKLVTQMGPHRIWGNRFLIPVYKTDAVGRPMLKAGLMLYDFLAGKNQPVAAHEMLSRKKTVERYPLMKPEGLVGGFTYGDCQEDDARMALEIVDGANRFGAVTVNHAKVNELHRASGKVIGAEVVDQLTGDKAVVRARLTINATGPWGDELLEGNRSVVRLVKGTHLIMPPLPMDDAMLITSPDDGRVIFVIPWYENTILGTTDDDYQGDAGDVKVTEDEIDYLLGIVNRALGGNGWTHDDVRGRYAGVRTLYDEPGKDASKVSRDWTLCEPEAGVLMPVGGKYTTARYDAGKIVDRAAELLEQTTSLGKPIGITLTDKRNFPWAPGGDFAAWFSAEQKLYVDAGLDAACAKHAARRFGTNGDRLRSILQRRPELATRVHANAPFCLAEIIYAAQYEMAFALDDVLRRRMPLTILARLSDDDLFAYAKLVADVLDWDTTQQEEQVANLKASLQ